MTIHDGERTPIGGMYVDLHGHHALLPAGRPAPRCSHGGTDVPAVWVLVRPAPKSPLPPSAA